MSSSAGPAGAGTSAGPGHRERLSPSAGTWVACLGIALTAGFVPLPVLGPAGALVAALVAAAAVTAALLAASARVEVSGGTLVAGRSRIPLHHLGRAEPLDAGAMRRVMGPDADARAHLVTRGWVRTGVRVAVEDPEDPTPYWLISTRRPAELAAALRRP
ncbi:Protein of unknown function (DUF3093) [Kineococcus xinjiangensis]|uniref:DUF3093 family protein n=1 Tax=Kineococcus xinjiangensis TaxID=512762 RepID=A0A2S6IVI6_9ACTN|nr:DUF3093 domain-containing protein [Kineococcus xinjiangensis]PPK98377.1 Protein of unknown function (DUF3093) [Kineococcus xinjiangensis]